MADIFASREAFENCAQRQLMQQEPVLSPKTGTSRAAAVLVPIVAGEQGLSVLLTQRSNDLPTHAGQIAFPGGKIDAGDASPLAAALRETREETGISANFINPVGYLDPFETGTGFHIVPVVGVLSPGFELVPEPGEVTEIFDVPLSFVMNSTNHQRKKAMWKGQMRHYHAVPYKDRYIWGATARMLVDLSRQMTGKAGER